MGGGSDPVAFEADDDGDLGGVFGAEAEGFGPVGGFVGGVPGFCLASFDLGGVSGWVSRNWLNGLDGVVRIPLLGRSLWLRGACALSDRRLASSC